MKPLQIVNLFCGILTLLFAFYLLYTNQLPTASIFSLIIGIWNIELASRGVA